MNIEDKIFQTILTKYNHFSTANVFKGQLPHNNKTQEPKDRIRIQHFTLKCTVNHCIIEQPVTF